MDFSSPSRALESLTRRRPALPNDVLKCAQLLIDNNRKDENESDTTGGTEAEENVRNITFLIKADEERWESLAVGLLLGTELLAKAAAAQSSSEVYIDGPRVPAEEKKLAEVEDALIDQKYSFDQISQLATLLYEATLKHLEHSEPRIRTLVAKAVGAHATWSVGLENPDDKTTQLSEIHTVERDAIHAQIVQSVNEHIKEGRDDAEKYSKSSTGALDDTTGWRALETNWQCLACWISSLGSKYYVHLLSGKTTTMDLLLRNLEFSSIVHVNRHVRAAAIAVLEQLIVSAGDDPIYWPYLETGSLRKTTVKVLKAGLGDNWSQVRMAASVLNRVFWSTLQERCRFPNENLKLLYPILVPRMCLNRFYLAQGVKLYSHHTWKLVFPENGVQVVAQAIAPVVRVSICCYTSLVDCFYAHTLSNFITYACSTMSRCAMLTTMSFAKLLAKLLQNWP